MQIVRCANGHWYDMEKYSDCPYCKNNNSEESSMLSGNVPQFGVSFESMNEAATVALAVGGGAVEIVGAAPMGKTPVMGMAAGKEPVTTAFYSRQRGTAFVTGWLVGRGGPVYGRDYRISFGKNWVGKSLSMDICIMEDTSIAPKHCAIVYDGKSNAFFVALEDGAITYLNGEMLSKSHRLSLGDEIRIGNSTFEFVPFCREGHIWKEENP